MATAVLAVCPSAWIAALAPAVEACPVTARSSGCGGCPEQQQQQQQSCPSSCRRCDPIVTADGTRAFASAPSPDPAPAAPPHRSSAELHVANVARRLAVQGTSPPIHLLVATLRN